MRSANSVDQTPTKSPSQMGPRRIPSSGVVADGKGRSDRGHPVPGHDRIVHFFLSVLEPNFLSESLHQCEHFLKLIGPGKECQDNVIQTSLLITW